MLGLRPSRESSLLSRRWRTVRRSNFSKPSRRLIVFWAWTETKDSYRLELQTILWLVNMYWCYQPSQSSFITRYNRCRLGRQMPSVVSKWFPLSSSVTKLAKQPLCRPFIVLILLPAKEVPANHVKALAKIYAWYQIFDWNLADR